MRRSTCWGCRAARPALAESAGQASDTAYPPGPGELTPGLSAGSASPFGLEAGAPLSPEAPWSPEGVLEPGAGAPGFGAESYGAPRRRRVWPVLVGAAAVAIVVIVVVALVFSHGAKGTPVTYGDPILYSQAAAPVASADSSAPDGPWTPIAFIGVGVSTDLSATGSGAGVALSSCSTVWVATTGPSLFPATPAAAPAGEVAGWLVLSSDASGDALLTMVTDLSGTVVAYPLEVQSQSCYTDFSSYMAPDAGAIDSSAAVAVANSNGGTAFLASYSLTTELLEITGDFWAVTYTTCSLVSGSTGASGNAFIGEVNATNGAWLTGGEVPEPC